MMPCGGSSSINSRGRVISTRPIASIYCSPPKSVSARLRQPLGEPREELKHQLQRTLAVRPAAIEIAAES